ncbi:MAG: right-handed parallel beta-helix repeat-containing protein [Planctomycetales bacterium]|nr:right-handed parallel beta-helix repeat-containing protein [Planctomycetales bacterium]
MYRSLLALWACWVAVCNVSTAEIQLHVASQGNDSAAGSAANPLASLAGAQSRIRELRASDEYSPQAISVLVHVGEYLLNEALHFDDRDSGDAEYPIVYQAIGGPVVLRGGKPLSEWERVTQLEGTSLADNSTSIWCADLRQFNEAELGQAQHRNLRSSPMPAFAQLLVPNRFARIARWPSEGWIDGGSIEWLGDGYVIDLPWHSQGGNTAIAMAHGFWKSDFEDSCVPVELTDINRLTKLSWPSTQLPIRSGARFRIEGTLAALDDRGEYYLDLDNKKIYYCDVLYPEKAFLVTQECPISMYGVSYLEFRGFTIEGSRHMGLEIAGGEAVHIDNCKFSQVANTGIHVYQGFDHRITNCRIEYTGADGVRVEAGDRLQLEPAGHLISNNLIEHFGLHFAAYHPGIYLHGVGITVNENQIRYGPHAAIIVSGNEHQISGNEITNVCMETDDVGAILVNGNPTFRGNEIRGNRIARCGSQSRTGIVGIYLDDFVSGTTVVGNIIQQLPRGIVIAGGRDNVVRENIIVDCLAAIQADGRGATWASNYFEGEESLFMQDLAEVQALETLYSERYPQLALSLENTPSLPLGNEIAQNWLDCPLGIDLQDPASQQHVAVEENQMKALVYLSRDDHGWYGLHRSLDSGFQIEPGKLIDTKE